MILFTRLKNIHLNFEDFKKAYVINDNNFLKIIYPLIKKNILYVFSFSASISIGDFTVISFFKNETFQTLPILLYKLIISYRFNEATQQYLEIRYRTFDKAYLYNSYQCSDYLTQVKNKYFF